MRPVSIFRTIRKSMYCIAYVIPVLLILIQFFATDVTMLGLPNSASSYSILWLAYSLYVVNNMLILNKALLGISQKVIRYVIVTIFAFLIAVTQFILSWFIVLVILSNFYVFLYG